jgi:anti-anti-sigma factor
MSEDPERLLGEVLSIQANQDRSGATIVLAGEFDLTGSQRFWSLVSEALAGRPKSITVDARGVEFIDSSALMALVRARTRLPRQMWRSVSASPRPRFAASPRYAGSRTC